MYLQQLKIQLYEYCNNLSFLIIYLKVAEISLFKNSIQDASHEKLMWNSNLRLELTLSKTINAKKFLPNSNQCKKKFHDPFHQFSILSFILSEVY